MTLYRKDVKLAPYFTAGKENTILFLAGVLEMRIP